MAPRQDVVEFPIGTLLQSGGVCEIGNFEVQPIHQLPLSIARDSVAHSALAGEEALPLLDGIRSRGDGIPEVPFFLGDHGHKRCGPL